MRITCPTTFTKSCVGRGEDCAEKVPAVTGCTIFTVKRRNRAHTVTLSRRPKHSSCGLSVEAQPMQQCAPAQDGPTQALLCNAWKTLHFWAFALNTFQCDEESATASSCGPIFCAMLFVLDHGPQRRFDAQAFGACQLVLSLADLKLVAGAMSPVRHCELDPC